MLLNFSSKTRKIIRSLRVQCAKSLVLLRKTHFSSRNPAVYFEISFVNRIFADIKSAILAYSHTVQRGFSPDVFQDVCALSLTMKDVAVTSQTTICYDKPTPIISQEICRRS